MLGYRVFSDSKASQRALLGEWVTDWLRNNPGVEVLDRWVRQSSDREYHCQSIVLQYEDHGRIVVDVPRPVPAQPRHARRASCECNPDYGYICPACERRIKGRGVRDA